MSILSRILLFRRGPTFGTLFLLCQPILAQPVLEHLEQPVTGMTYSSALRSQGHRICPKAVSDILQISDNMLDLSQSYDVFGIPITLPVALTSGQIRVKNASAQLKAVTFQLLSSLLSFEVLLERQLYFELMQPVLLEQLAYLKMEVLDLNEQIVFHLTTTTGAGSERGYLRKIQFIAGIHFEDIEKYELLLTQLERGYLQSTTSGELLHSLSKL